MKVNKLEKKIIKEFEEIKKDLIDSINKIHLKFNTKYLEYPLVLCDRFCIVKYNRESKIIECIKYGVYDEKKKDIVNKEIKLNLKVG